MLKMNKPSKIILMQDARTVVRSAGTVLYVDPWLPAGKHDYQDDHNTPWVGHHEVKKMHRYRAAGCPLHAVM